MSADQSEPIVQSSAHKHRILEQAKLIWKRLSEICAVLAVIIAVSWTFPTQFIDRLFKTQDQMLDDAQKSILDTADLFRQRAVDLASNYDQQTKLFLISADNVKINHKLSIISSYPAYIFHKLTYTENVNFGDMLSISNRFDEAMVFYNAALFVASRDGIEATSAYRSMANSTLTKSRSDALTVARHYFRMALQSAINESTSSPFAKITVLADIATAEMRYGDWTCGSEIAEKVQSDVAAAPTSSESLTWLAAYKSQVSSISKPVKFAPTVCDYLSLK